MGSKKRRTSKAARKQSRSSKIPTWFGDKDVPVRVKREVEDALARHAADNGLAVGSARFGKLSLTDICASLKLVNPDRWREVEPGMMNPGTQPAMKALASHLQDCKRRRKMMAQMVADVQAPHDQAQSDAQSSQSGAEEGEEEEEAQADASDGDHRADQEPAYAKGDPRELMQEGAATDSQTTPLIAQIFGQIREAARDTTKEAAEHKSQAAQLRITTDGVDRWALIGEWCARVKFHYKELERAEAEVIRLTEPTPLNYAYTMAADRWAAASQKSGEQQDEQPSADGARD